MSSDVITEFLRKRTIISDFQLIDHVAKSEKRYETLPKIQGKIELSETQLVSALESWKEQVEEFAKFLEKTARSLLAKTEGVVLYPLEGKWMKEAALVCEIFRYPGISKNSGLLDIRKLQRHVADLLIDETKPLQFSIAWGQAKQTCGLLKTSGPMADLAEVFAILQLSVILQAVKQIFGSKREVKLKVLTGVSRFAMAFYPNEAINETYDYQRQLLADYFNGPGQIVFEPYIKRGEKLSEKEKQRMKAFETNCALVKEAHVKGIYNHILLSINWHDLLTAEQSIQLAHPGVEDSLPSVRAWIKTQPDFETLLRRVLVCLIQQREPSNFFSLDNLAYQKLVFIVDEVTRDSARKYIALQYTDAGFDVNDDSSNMNGIRLTVHEKKDRADIPAIFTLGKLGGNYLSQNVTVLLDSRGEVRFKSLVEILDEYPVKGVYAAKMDESLPLSWLSHSQPICLIDDRCPDDLVVEKLKKAFSTWLEGILEI